MKNKMLLPLLAVVFAIAGAFASSPLVQMGWYDPGTGGVFGQITNPAGDTPVCDLEGDIICTIEVNPFHTYNAYDSKVNAEAGTSNGLLKYTQE